MDRGKRTTMDDCILNYRFSEIEILIVCLLVNLLVKKIWGLYKVTLGLVHSSRQAVKLTFFASCLIFFFAGAPPLALCSCPFFLCLHSTMFP